uniref:BPTI/Kunitz domain-containing protein 5 n=1 Tax=Margaritifera margaritifera TaxID=102329 RepID=KCP5_PINMG|nr:RecName: Full=BPTI/Kunitz domain-containing protein 5; AltName: Full=Nacre serine protease inhibitor 5; Flags: Precursor [Pinctada margaritifera]CCE46181.1 nacre serine protease inhibitor 5 [Pinctada margaritifera]
MIRLYIQCLILWIIILPLLAAREGFGGRCLKPKDKGNRSCGRSQKYYYFNAEKGRCYRFTYYGCKGNSNRFKKKSDCVSSCACQAVLDHGSHCKSKAKRKEGSKVRYYFDSESGLCRKFWYVGCGGNHNKFTSKTSCKKVCVKDAPKRSKSSKPTSKTFSKNAQYSMNSLLRMLKNLSKKVM